MASNEAITSHLWAAVSGTTSVHAVQVYVLKYNRLRVFCAKTQTRITATNEVNKKCAELAHGLQPRWKSKDSVWSFHFPTSPQERAQDQCRPTRLVQSTCSSRSYSRVWGPKCSKNV